MKVSRAFVGPIAWFDSFFFPEHAEIETNRSYLRAVAGYDWVNGEGFRFKTAFRVKVRVPGVKERLNIIFSDEDERDFEQPTRARPLAATREAAPVTDRNDRRRAGLGYTVFDYLESRVDIETALRSRARGEVSMRYRQNFPAFEKTKGRVALTGFWLQGTGFGSRGRLDFETPTSDKNVFRVNNTFTQIHGIKGVVEEHRMSYDMQVSDKAGLSPGIGMNADTRPVWRATAYYVSVLYRQSFYRSWLFYEVEPGVNWTRNEFGARPPILTNAVRLEVQFRTAPQ